MENEKPILIKAGDSVLDDGSPAFSIQYKKRFLYSKYNPKKNIVAAIEQAEIKPGTLILVFSPCLFYGIGELVKKCGAELGKSVYIIALERERELYQLTVSRSSEQATVTGNSNRHEVQFFPYEKLNTAGINEFLQCLANGIPKFEGLTLPAPGSVRRAMRFDFSGGTAFNADFYNEFFNLTQNAVTQFWKNRITLVKLGRLYCKNIFKNVITAATSIKFSDMQKSVDRPILVLGAGESLEQWTGKSNRQQDMRDFFIIAVDAALAPLLAAGIVPNAVVATEAQLAIEKAYVGVSGAAGGQKPILFCDLTSRHTIPRLDCFEPCFFFSEFVSNNFTARLKNAGVLPQTIPPLGSVGLSATYIALLLRKNEDVPVYVSGLDFSFSLGKTHANGTMAHKARLATNNRFNPLANYGAAFSLGAEKIIGKDGKEIFTTKNLSGYAALFNNFFAGTKNLFDCGNLQLIIGGSLEASRASNNCGFSSGSSIESPASSVKGFTKNNNIEPTRAFLWEERGALHNLADILSNGENAQSRDKTISYNEQILQLLECREYLFLHFPDGAAVSLETNFLNRVRTQIDFFLKEIDCVLQRI